MLFLFLTDGDYVPTPNETNTGGGGNIGRDVGTGGGDFAGRDTQEQNVNVSLANNDHLQAVRHQLSRIEDNTSYRLGFIERDIKDVQRDQLALRGELNQFKSEIKAEIAARQPVNVSATTVILIVLGSIIAISLVIGLGIYLGRLH